METIRLGGLWDGATKHQAGSVWDKNLIAPTIDTMQGGGREPMIIDDTYANRKPRVYEDYSPALRSEREGLKTIEKADFCIGGLQEHQTPRTDGISPTLTSAMGMGGGQTPIINCQYRIRKLTPLSCWRLMDFTDEDFEKAAQVNSNTQLYKQAGNSIIRNVLVAILGQLIEGKEDAYRKV